MFVPGLHFIYDSSVYDLPQLFSNSIAETPFLNNQNAILLTVTATGGSADRIFDVYTTSELGLISTKIARVYIDQLANDSDSIYSTTVDLCLPPGINRIAFVGISKSDYVTLNSVDLLSSSCVVPHTTLSGSSGYGDAYVGEFGSKTLNRKGLEMSGL